MTALHATRMPPAPMPEYRQFQRIDAAFRDGDLTALRAAVDDPEDVPNRPMPLAEYGQRRQIPGQDRLRP